MPKNNLPTFVYLVLFTSLGLNLFQLHSSYQSSLHLVTAVTDGDTVVVDGNQVLRLFSLDAAEKEFCSGEESREYLESLVLNKKVKVKAVGYDTFHRSLSIIYLQGKNINEAILLAGMAEYSSDKDVDRDIFQKAAQTAEDQQLGLYGLCRTKTPDNPKCPIKGIIRRKLKTYTIPTCVGSYSRTLLKKDYGDQWFCTETEAIKAGFTKSTDCH